MKKKKNKNCFLKKCELCSSVSVIEPVLRDPNHTIFSQKVYIYPFVKVLNG